MRRTMKGRSIVAKKKTSLLGIELAFYEENKNDFLREHANRHLLIKGQELVGHFSTRDRAVGEGIRRFGREPFLVRLSGTDTMEFTVPLLALGLPCQS